MRIALLAILLLASLSCGGALNRVHVTRCRIQINRIFAIEGAKKWDFTDNTPELYVVLGQGPAERRTSPPRHGAWEWVPPPAEASFSYEEPLARILVSVYDYDGESTSASVSDRIVNPDHTLVDSLIGEALINHDDLVFSQEVLLQGASGNLLLQNGLGGVSLYYENFSD